MNITDLSSEQLRKAATIKEQITELEKQLQAMLGGSLGDAPPAKGGLTEAGRARLSALAKARWAKRKALPKATEPKPTGSGKKTMSAAARAKISAAAKARWAKIKAAKRK